MNFRLYPCFHQPIDNIASHRRRMIGLLIAFAGPSGNSNGAGRGNTARNIRMSPGR